MMRQGHAARLRMLVNLDRGLVGGLKYLGEADLLQQLRKARIQPHAV